jgi:hypothetical protein
MGAVFGRRAGVIVAWIAVVPALGVIGLIVAYAIYRLALPHCLEDAGGSSYCPPRASDILIFAVFPLIVAISAGLKLRRLRKPVIG